jgi:hypothetical protein
VIAFVRASELYDVTAGVSRPHPAEDTDDTDGEEDAER